MGIVAAPVATRCLAQALYSTAINRIVYHYTVVFEPSVKEY